MYKYDRKIVGYYEGLETDMVKEFVLLRSNKVDSIYTELDKADGASKKFTFNFKSDLLSGDRNYSKVVAISPDHDTAYSYPYYHFSLDQEPPVVPTNLWRD